MVGLSRENVIFSRDNAALSRDIVTFPRGGNAFSRDEGPFSRAAGIETRTGIELIGKEPPEVRASNSEFRRLLIA